MVKTVFIAQVVVEKPGMYAFARLEREVDLPFAIRKDEHVEFVQDEPAGSLEVEFTCFSIPRAKLEAFLEESVCKSPDEMEEELSFWAERGFVVVASSQQNNKATT